MVMADLSGFTALSERLARLGDEGAERLTDIINSFFERMLKTASRYGGDTLTFGGDAILSALRRPRSRRAGGDRRSRDARTGRAGGGGRDRRRQGQDRHVGRRSQRRVRAGRRGPGRRACPLGRAWSRRRADRARRGASRARSTRRFDSCKELCRSARDSSRPATSGGSTSSAPVLCRASARAAGGLRRAASTTRAVPPSLREDDRRYRGKGARACHGGQCGCRAKTNDTTDRGRAAITNATGGHGGIPPSRARAPPHRDRLRRHPRPQRGHRGAGPRRGRGAAAVLHGDAHRGSPRSTTASSSAATSPRRDPSSSSPSGRRWPTSTPRPTPPASRSI